MWIMVAGPYGLTSQPPEKRRENWIELQEAARAVFRKGHVPVVGLNLALPLLLTLDFPFWNQNVDASIVQMIDQLSVAMASRCDAILRIGGPSGGADAEVAAVQAKGGLIFYSIADVPIE